MSDCGCGGGWQPEPYVGSTHASWCAMYTNELELYIEKLEEKAAEDASYIQHLTDGWNAAHARERQHEETIRKARVWLMEAMAATRAPGGQVVSEYHVVLPWVNEKLGAILKGD